MSDNEKSTAAVPDQARSMPLRAQADSAAMLPVSSDAPEQRFDVVKEYHRLLVAEWERCYERPCAVALPNAAEQAALYGLEKLLRATPKGDDDPADPLRWTMHLIFDGGLVRTVSGVYDLANMKKRDEQR